MPERRDIDRIRAYVEGTLPPAERAEIDARAAREPDLETLLASYAEVHASADPALAAPPPLTVAFEDLRLDDAPPAPVFFLSRVPRVAVAAAAALLLGVGVYFAVRANQEAPAGPKSLILAAIPLDPVAIPQAPEIPAALADYAPTDDRGLRFIEALASKTDSNGFASAKAVAKITGRPLIVFIYHPTCPYCLEYAKGPFKDSAVAKAAAEAVLARVNVMTMDPSDVPGDAGWPIFLAYTPDGTLAQKFGNLLKAEDLAKKIEQAVAAARGAAARTPRPWEETRALAKDLREADDEEASPARRAALCASVAAADPSGPFGAAAKARLAKAAEAAREDLMRIRDAAADVGKLTALQLLDQAMLRHAGTPYESDFASVKARLARDEVFPNLEVRR